MLLLLAAFLLCVVIHVSVMAWVGLEFGLGLREISIGFGPRLLRVGPLRISLVPIGGAVRFETSDYYSEQAESPRAIVPGKSYEEAPLLVRLLIAISGCAALMAFAFGCLGMEAASALVSGFAQIFNGATDPRGTGVPLLATAAQVAATQGFLAVLGLTAAKLAAFNLLPFAGLNGFEVLSQLLGYKRLSPATQQRLFMMLWLPGIALMVMWAYALILYLMH